MPLFIITHQGVPVGTVELEPDRLIAAGVVRTLAGYETLRPAARAAGLALLGLQRHAPEALEAALRRAGLAGAPPPTVDDPAGVSPAEAVVARLTTVAGWAEAGSARAALAAAAALGRGLELRDAEGAYVATEFIELAEWPGASGAAAAPAPDVAAWVGFEAAAAAVPARPRPEPVGAPASRPAA